MDSVPVNICSFQCPNEPMEKQNTFSGPITNNQEGAKKKKYIIIGVIITLSLVLCTVISVVSILAYGSSQVSEKELDKMKEDFTKEVQNKLKELLANTENLNRDEDTLIQEEIDKLLIAYSALKQMKGYIDWLKVLKTALKAFIKAFKLNQNLK
ncbi:unnamed protein product, partial [Brachionus calyciflorus]